MKTILITVMLLLFSFGICSASDDSSDFVLLFEKVETLIFEPITGGKKLIGFSIPSKEEESFWHGNRTIQTKLIYFTKLEEEFGCKPISINYFKGTYGPIPSYIEIQCSSVKEK